MCIYKYLQILMLFFTHTNIMDFISIWSCADAVFSSYMLICIYIYIYINNPPCCLSWLFPNRRLMSLIRMWLPSSSGVILCG